MKAVAMGGGAGEEGWKVRGHKEGRTVTEEIQVC